MPRASAPRFPIIAVTLGLMTGGANAAGWGSDWGPESPYYRYPAGLSLTLRQALTVPPEAATVRLQYGRVVASNAVQEHDAHCIFELDTVRETPQTVRPQNMRVTDVRRSVSTFSGMPVWPYPPFLSGRVGWNGDGGPSHIYYKTEFRLRSEVQPEVRSLTCQSNQMAPGIGIMRHLTLAEIRQALGDYFNLELPTVQGRVP
jgi:hypothetical protein